MSRKTSGSLQERASADAAADDAAADDATVGDAAESTAESTPGEPSGPAADSPGGDSAAGAEGSQSAAAARNAVGAKVATAPADADAGSATGASAERAVDTTEEKAEGDAAARAEPEATGEAAPAARAGEAGQRGRRVLAVARRGLVPALSVLAIAATVAAVFFGWKVKQHNDLQAAADEALAAARAYAVTLTSVDSNNLDRDFAAVLDGSTGEFRDMYTRSSGQLRELLVENKATGQGTVLDAAVKSAGETEVEVLLFIDQTVTNTASADPRIDRSRVVMTMQLVDGRWLAARVYLP
ncbi:hypothetical protein [Nocardia shimofusensis]|uniref:hypothetical protein n=1 Tax=Nocardia shimofusensis TaxID=228596 RepID=UPI000B277DA6|nr:hypothetical protein [Nocardia shimofusensis]